MADLVYGLAPKLHWQHTSHSIKLVSGVWHQGYTCFTCWANQCERNVANHWILCDKVTTNNLLYIYLISEDRIQYWSNCNLFSLFDLYLLPLRFRLLADHCGSPFDPLLPILSHELVVDLRKSYQWSVLTAGYIATWYKHSVHNWYVCLLIRSPYPILHPVWYAKGKPEAILVNIPALWKSTVVH